MQSTPTKLTLDRFAQIMGIPRLHFWGVNIEAMQKLCGQAWFQESWMDADRVGRDDVAQAIAEAEADIEQLIGYRLLPTWEVDEWTPTVRPYRRAAFNLNSHDVRGFNQTGEARWGYLLTGGVRSVVTLSGNEAISYTNTKPPTAYKDEASITFTASEDYPDDEVALFYPEHEGDERWRIRPLRVSHSPLTLEYTIKFAREMALIPDFLETNDPTSLRAADGTDDANFLTHAAVCRVFNDPQQQATMLWEGGGGCGSGACGACSYGTQTACLLLRGDPRLSTVVFQAADWDPVTNTFTGTTMEVCREPDLLRLWYYAGWRDKSNARPTVEMDGQWARVVAYLAAAKLNRPVCQCSTAAFERWQDDLAFAGGAKELAAYNLSTSDLDNPLGTRRGAVNAWKRVNMPGVAVARGAYAG